MLIRLAHPFAFTAFLDHIGADTDGYFQRQGLPAMCSDPNVFVPLDRAWALFDDAIQREGEDLAWHVGRFVGEHNLHAQLVKKLSSAPTLFQALRRLVLQINAEASHIRLGIIEGEEEILLFTTGYFDLRDHPGFAGSQAYQLAVYITLIQHFAGRNWQPKLIGICGLSVPSSLSGLFPNSRIRLKQPFSYISIPRNILHQQCVSELSVPDDQTALVLPNELSFPEILAFLITPYLPHGYPSVQLASSLVDVSPRTLSRKLSQHETTYQALIDELRFNRARELLRETDAPIREIAAATGFSDQANLSRLFRRVAGQSPRQFRRNDGEKGKKGDGAN